MWDWICSCGQVEVTLSGRFSCEQSPQRVRISSNWLFLCICWVSEVSQRTREIIMCDWKACVMILMSPLCSVRKANLFKFLLNLEFPVLFWGCWPVYDFKLRNMFVFLVHKWINKFCSQRKWNETSQNTAARQVAGSATGSENIWDNASNKISNKNLLSCRNLSCYISVSFGGTTPALEMTRLWSCSTHAAHMALRWQRTPRLETGGWWRWG